MVQDTWCSKLLTPALVLSNSCSRSGQQPNLDPSGPGRWLHTHHLRHSKPEDGNVITSNYPNNTRYVFKDTDGQTVSSALNTVAASGSSVTAFATVGGHAYGGVNGQFDGEIIVNTNAGEVDLLDPLTNTSVAIATGGTRGDYVSPDTNNGTLFLDYSDTIERLSCGPNCSIGGGPNPPPSNTPEPSTFALLGLPLLAIGAGSLRRRKA